MTLISKLAISAVAVSLLAIGALDLRHHDAQRQRLHTIYQETGLAATEEQLGQLLNRDPDAIESTDRLALALIAQLLDPRSRQAAASPKELQSLFEAQIKHLDVAEQLARESIKQRPNSWRALTAIGAAIYLRRSFARDDRLVRNYRDWERPLESARALAPARAEPSRFLTMAYLEVWPMLSKEKQQLTRDLLKTSLSDPAVYRVTIEPWLAVADNDLDALGLLPVEGWVFKDLRVRFTTRGNLELAVEANRRFRRRIAEETQEQLALIQKANARGDIIGARKQVDRALGQLPVDQGYASQAQALLQSLPAGPLATNFAGNVAVWMNFNSEQCLRSHCAFATDLVKRLFYTVPSDARGLRARLALADLNGANSAELKLEQRCSREARVYWLHKAKFLLERGQVSDARTALLSCPVAPQRQERELLYQRLFESLRPSNTPAQAVTVFGTSVRPHIAEYHPPTQSIEFALPRGDYEIELVPTVADERHSLIELLVDGAVIATMAVGPELRPQAVRVSATGFPQQLTQRLVAGQPKRLRFSEALPVGPARQL